MYPRLRHGSFARRDVFQGQEFASSSPFHFADHGGAPGAAVRRRADFMRQFRSVASRDARRAADAADDTFLKCKLRHEERSVNGAAVHRDLAPPARGSDLPAAADRVDGAFCPVARSSCDGSPAIREARGPRSAMPIA
jgi:hypothetical protein